MSFQTFLAAPRPHLSALNTFTDQMHGKYGGQVGTDMDDDTWRAMTPEEVVEYRRLETLADAEHEQLKELHRNPTALAPPRPRTRRRSRACQTTPVPYVHRPSGRSDRWRGPGGHLQADRRRRWRAHYRSWLAVRSDRHPGVCADRRRPGAELRGQGMSKQTLLIDATGQILNWIRMATSEPADGMTVAGLQVHVQRAESPSHRPWPRLPLNVPDAQAIAFILAEIAHNMPAVAAGANSFHTLSDFGELCREASYLSFRARCWPTISAGLLELAKAFLRQANADAPAPSAVEAAELMDAGQEKDLAAAIEAVRRARFAYSRVGLFR